MSLPFVSTVLASALDQTSVSDFAVKFIDILSSPVGSVVFGTTFIVLFVAIGSLAWGLFKYGKDIKKLNEFETMTKLASLARTMKDNIDSYGSVGLKLDTFSSEVEETKRRLATLTSKLNAVESLIETRQPVSTAPAVAYAQVQGQRSLNDPADIQNWSTIQTGWREVRDEFEAAIELLHGATRRKYGDAPRYTYADIIRWLKDDGVLTTKGFLEASNMNQLFLSSRPRNAPIDPSNVQNFLTWKASVLKELKRFKANPKAARQAERQSETVSSEPPANPSTEDELLGLIQGRSRETVGG